MLQCYLCGCDLIADVQTSEHVIPNCIGGSWESRQLICVSCNHGTSDLEVELGKATVAFASKLNIHRDRGETPRFRATDAATGELHDVSPGWVTQRVNPKVEVVETGLMISAGTRQRLLQELNRLKKDHPDANVSEPIREIGEGGQRITFEVTISQKLLLRSAAKIVNNFYVAQGGNRNRLSQVASFIRHGGDNSYAWFAFIEIWRGLWKEPFHAVVIHGDEEQKILYGYVEIFGCMGVIVVMDPGYDGPPLLDSYVFDPVQGKKVTWTLDSFAFPDIIKYLQLKPMPQSISWTGSPHG